MGKEHLSRNAMEEKSGSPPRSESISDALNEKSSNDENHFEFERLISEFLSTIIGLPIEDLRYGLETWLKKVRSILWSRPDCRLGTEQG